LSVDDWRTDVSLQDKTRSAVSETVIGPGDGGDDDVGFPSSGANAWPLTGTPEPVPNFGKITFSATQIDGLPLGTFSSELTQDDFYDSTLTTLEVSTGKISHNGKFFKTTFVSP
jgi:hypothetical protein